MEIREIREGQHTLKNSQPMTCVVIIMSLLQGKEGGKKKKKKEKFV